MLSGLDTVLNALIEAAASDLSRPETKKVLRENLDNTISNLLGINVQNPLVRPIYEQFINNKFNDIYELLGVVVSNPPESIDESAAILKEETNSKINSFRDKLKQRLNKE